MKLTTRISLFFLITGTIMTIIGVSFVYLNIQKSLENVNNAR